jgi:hypothetical protein
LTIAAMASSHFQHCLRTRMTPCESLECVRLVAERLFTANEWSLALSAFMLAALVITNRDARRALFQACDETLLPREFI